ncbi:uncharacterized protein (DUF302 family) [Roseibium hamelinense]|uniref:Uncharacterized protein (DUF302 family) n=1 Tax=Roseibium hamelinense TaxID=150831 RepID=A0A562T2U2_9HYPH|nr:DUF302 domain-containing protein [Roseibium hamelinense]TWI87156.1 uncharacterized protein (DUF302 family) [Roseibium hamelinense]
MPRHFFIYPLLMCALILSSAALAQSVEPRPGWRVVKTEQSYDELVESVSSSIKAEGMLLVTQASASAGAKGQGITIPGNRVIGVYRNDFARRMLDASVASGIEAPIRFYITENTDGTGTLSWKTPSFVFEPYMGESGGQLKALASELDGVFMKIADRAVGSEN